MDTAMPQSNPQAEIQNILTDVSSSLQNAPKRKMNKQRLWGVVFFLLVLISVFVVIVIRSKPEQKALSEQEIARIVKVLEDRDSQPVTNIVVQDVSNLLDERTDQEYAPTSSERNDIISTIENRQ